MSNKNVASKKTTASKSSVAGRSTGTHSTTKSSTARTATTAKKTPKTRSGSTKLSKQEAAEIRARYFEEQQERKEVHDEILLIITGLVCILLYLSYFGLCGIVGKGINTVVFGFLGGYLPYLFPVALFFLVAFVLSNSGNRLANRRMLYFLGTLFVVSALIHIFSGCASQYDFFGAFTKGASDHVGGGLFGAVLSKPLISAFGKVASIIILFALLVIFFVLISGHAIFASIRRWKNKHSQENYAAYEAEYLEKQAKEREMHSVAPKEHYHQMNLNDIQEETHKRRLVVVDAVPPSQPIDTSFYEEPKKAPKNKKTTFLDRLMNRAEETSSNPTGFNSSIPAQYAPIMPAETTFSNNTSEPYEQELKRKFASTGDKAHQDTSVQNHSYDEDDFSAVSIVNMHDSEKKHETEVFPSTTKSEAPTQNTTESPHASGRPTAKTENASEDEPMVISQEPVEKPYAFPPLSLLTRPHSTSRGMSNQQLKETAAKLQNTLRSFGVNVTITNISCGPSVTRYELQPEQGVKVSRITSLADDIKLNLAAADIRIEAPIPGKAAVGIEVPNVENSMVLLRDLFESNEYKHTTNKIAFAVGKDISGDVIVADIAKMPHLLIAGATGSGKSVCINTLIMSILFKYEPKDVRLIMVDPKVVELSVYNGIPHLLIPVVTDPKKASSALNWAVMEMTDRYNKFAEMGVRDLGSYNRKVEESKEELVDAAGIIRTKLPQIVIIVDELADLMMVAPGEVEDSICRLAQLARAAGIHLVIATQRPSVNVITGLIKANVPSRIAFAVASAIDSRTILDQAGADKLLGKGDMLFFPQGLPKPTRVQGAFISDTEVNAVVEYLKSSNQDASYNDDVANHIASGISSGGTTASGGGNERDEYFAEAGRFIIEKEKASIGMLQRVYKIGFNRAARIMDQLAEAGVVGPEEGTKPRKILMSAEEFEQYVSDYV